MPEQVATYRRVKLHEGNKERGKALSARVSPLVDESIAVTTVPAASLTWQEALMLLRLRWHIDLLFKRWKHEREAAGCATR